MKLKNFFSSTIVKYIFSYAVVLVTVVTGLFFIINYQLKREYLKMYMQESRNQISDAADRISKGFIEIEKTNFSLTSDVNIISARYSNSAYSRYQIIKELGKYCSRNNLSEDIIFYDRKKDVAYSTTHQCKVSIDSINFTMYGKNDILIPKSYYDSDTSFGKIYTIANETTMMLLFSPADVSSDFRVIYVLNQDELHSIMNSCLSKGISGIELTDLTGGTLLSSGTQLSFDKNGNFLQPEEDVFSLKLSYPTILFYAVFDKDFMQASTNKAFINTYLTAGLLIIFGVILTFFSMKMTYYPLHKLKKHITNSEGHFSNDITMLNNIYQASEELNMFLKKSLNNYKTVIHESILNSKIPSQNISNAAFDNIDKLFVSGNKLILLVVKILFTGSSEGDTLERIQSHFRDACTSIILEADRKRVSLLLAWEDEKNQDDLISNRPLKTLLDQMPCMIAFSDYSTNPLDIARLYSNATAAESFLDSDCRILGYDDISESPDNYEENYSYKLFDQFAVALEKMDSQNSFRLVKELSNSIDVENDAEMFIRCILIDTTTLIGTFMSRNAVKYEKYRTIFTYTLDLCRKSNYIETKKEILKNFNDMLEILFSEASNSNICFSQIEAFVKENFCQSDFSITVLANHFNVSIAYMSFLFKKKFNINFSNFVWNLRYKKSQMLLSSTNYSIEKIGALIGYDNASSFRRKFKEEIGISPSQYRKKIRETPCSQLD